MDYVVEHKAGENQKGDEKIMPAPKDPEKREIWINRLSESCKGRPSAFRGKRHSPEAKKKVSDANKGRFSGEKNPMFGVHLTGDKHPNFGKSMSEEQKKKISQTKKGKKIGPDSYWYGKKIPEETLKKLSKVRKGLLVGERNGRWKGGKSFEPYCEKFNREFKERVREFYGRTCVECGKTEAENNRKLEVHHVNFDKSSCCSDVKPLFVALCKSCHVRTNSNREYWEDRYTRLVNEKFGGVCYLQKEDV